MKKFTVALLRPYRFITDELDGYQTLEDLGYLALVEAETIKEAIMFARQEVYWADRRYCNRQLKERCLPTIKAAEYTMLWVLPGHINAVAYGFEGQQ